MNVSLTPELEKLVNERVRSGMYSSASEVIREALRLLNERDELRRQQLEQLRKEVAIGIAQADRGEVAPLSLRKMKHRLSKRLRQTRRAKNP
ncbi:MAG: type II toxin-antitoxin system ParD family antitoxin [Acidobacteria bacterium]|nr:type II toxin-antitoxin system ParD family antitoxin [Acidobacteriota bacterium]